MYINVLALLMLYLASLAAMAARTSAVLFRSRVIILILYSSSAVRVLLNLDRGRACLVVSTLRLFTFCLASPAVEEVATVAVGAGGVQLEELLAAYGELEAVSPSNFCG
jgi:hypothetical protein